MKTTEYHASLIHISYVDLPNEETKRIRENMGLRICYDWQPPTIDSYNAIVDLSISESDLLTNEDLALEMYQATMKAHREGHDLDCQMIVRNDSASADDLKWSQMARRMAMVQDIAVSHILFGFKRLTPFVRFS